VSTSNTPGRTKIITVKRVGPNGSITQSRSFTISADAATGLGGGQKIIVQRSNGGNAQVVQAVPAQAAPIGSQATGTIKIPISVVQSTSSNLLSQPQTVIVTTMGNSQSFENQFKQYAVANTSSVDSKVNMTVKDSIFASSAAQNIVRTQPHVIHINRPSATTSNQLLTRNLPQNARLVSSQSMASAGNQSLRVIQRPFQNNGSSPGLIHSQSVPGNLTTYSNITNIPRHMTEQRDTNSPPPIIVNQSGFGGNGKLVLNNLYENGINSMDPMSAMQRSVQNIPAPKITNKDLSRMWSNQDIRLKNITQNVVSIIIIINGNSSRVFLSLFMLTAIFLLNWCMDKKPIKKIEDLYKFFCQSLLFGCSNQSHCIFDICSFWSE
jgi:hypothetical protein